MPDVNFLGPAGRLEGKYFAQKEKNSPIAVILHPHPLHGGNMNNKVTYRLFETFVRCGFSVLRFNFRGVGNSEGTFDNGVGELSDAAAALDWLHSNHPHTPQIWLAGFSFGSWITLQMLMRRPDLKRFIAVSPPAGLYDMSFLSPCPTTGLVVYGGSDELTSAADTEAMLKGTTRQKGIQIHAAKIPGADHFYTMHTEELVATLGQYISTEMKKPGR